MRNVTERPDRDGYLTPDAYSLRFGDNARSEHVPFGALIEFLPSRPDE